MRPFPDAGASLQQVSADGGVEPVWAHSGRELFYRNGANELVAVEVKFDYQFSENILIRGRYWFQDLNVTDWALDGVDPDTMRRIIGLGNQSPRYSVHIIGISTIYRF